MKKALHAIAETGRCRWTTVGAVTLAALVATADLQAQSTKPIRVARRVSTTSVDSSHPLGPAIRYARRSYEPLSKVKDFEANFTKNEVVNGTRIKQQMRMRYREKPMSVYLGFVGEFKGREVLYIDGKNDGDLLVHDIGIKALVGTIGLNPTGDMAMKENRYPITKIGIANLLDAVILQWENEARIAKPTVKYYPNAKVGDAQCKVIESTHAKKVSGLTFYRTRLFIDRDSGLPIRIQQYGFPKSGEDAPLLEDYTYSNVKTNVGLTDRDFDRENPKYDF